MAKEQRWQRSAIVTDIKTSAISPVQNSPPMIFANFNHCWSICVKNGDEVIKSAAIAHLKSISHWDDQTMWVDGLIHFGIPVEKK